MVKNVAMPKSKKYAKALKEYSVSESAPPQSSFAVIGNQHEPIGRRINNDMELLKCSMCAFSTTSKHHFQQHVRRHKSICLNCRTKFACWENYVHHIEFCTRRFGICVVPRGFSPPPIQNNGMKHQCNFCKEKFLSATRLSHHQKKNCRKRFVSNKWVIKL